jgi:hypothetical protein
MPSDEVFSLSDGHSPGEAHSSVVRRGSARISANKFQVRVIFWLQGGTGGLEKILIYTGKFSVGLEKFN